MARLADLESAVGQSYSTVQVIAIDEAQFFPDLLEFCTEASDLDNKQVLVAGLDGDFQRQRFGQVGSYPGYFERSETHSTRYLQTMSRCQTRFVCDSWSMQSHY